MGAKLSRRRSECAAGAEGVAAEIPATEQPEGAEAVATTESNEQKPEKAENAAEPKTSEMDTAPSEPSSNLGAMETITQAVEGIVSSVSDQIAGPVEDIVNKGMGAVEAMMAAVSVKDDPTEPAAQPKAEPLVDLSEEAKPKIPEPPEEPAHLPSEPSTQEDLLLLQHNAESLLPEPVFAVMAKDVSAVVAEDEGIPIQNDAQAPSESEEPLVCMKQDTAPAEDLLNCEAVADPITLNSDPLVEQALSTAINTVNDLI